MLARSSRSGRPAQLYRDHVLNSTRLALERVQQLLRYYRGDRGPELENAVHRGSLYSDLGKLSALNQRCLAGALQQHLPLIHTDAGTQALLRADALEAAILAYSHHGWLPDVREQQRGVQGRGRFRAATGARTEVGYKEQQQREDTYADTDAHLKEYQQQHEQLVGADRLPASEPRPPFSGLLRRLGLSCVVDGDRTDAAGGELPQPAANCRWEERQAALDHHVAGLTSGSPGQKELRRQVYESCRRGFLPSPLAICTGVCGSGKTTAVMAGSLRLAVAHGLRHIIVVLPRISIIQQAVDVYRRALVLPGERPEDVVGEYHHEIDLRQVGALWEQPILVTTSVQFFETLLAAAATRLRRLQQLPGSAVFIDEAHLALPPENWPLAWDTVQELTRDWSCHFIMASGSLSRPWEMERLVGVPRILPDILPLELRQAAERLEDRRVRCRFAGERPWGYEDLLRETAAAPGPQLIVLNTVQSAALVARYLRGKGRQVLHLSTALTPPDRKRVIQEVEGRLQRKDKDWCLVATSCVESGMDFSFGYGFREEAGAVSLLQLKGRVNRNDERAGAEVVVFRLAVGKGLIRNPGLEIETKVCREMFAADWFDGSRTLTDLSTEALRREVAYHEQKKLQAARLNERKENYPEVEELSRVIKEQTCLAIVDQALQARLRRGERVSVNEVTQGSVRLWGPKVRQLRLEPVESDSMHSYYWNRDYDPDFLGYMAGLLTEIDGFAII